MKIFHKVFLAVALAFCCVYSFADNTASSEIMRAMKDEMARSLANLKKDNLAKPHFITYHVEQIIRFAFSANQGAFYEERASSDTGLKVSLRVGSHKEDSSFFDSYIHSVSSKQIPAAGYDAIRAGLWQETNKAFTDALATLAKKQAYKKSKNIAEEFPDFSPAKPATYTQDFTMPQIDKDYWRDLAKTISAQGDLKEIDVFRATITIIFRPSYFLSSEGAMYMRDNYTIEIFIRAEAKTKNGFELRENKQITYADFKDVPEKEELLLKAREFAKDFAALTQAQKAEPFIGPVMFEKTAAAALLSDLFMRGINETKPVHTGGGEPRQGEFAQKKGLKIMPADFDVFDKPQEQYFNGIRLLGYSPVDDEGVATQNLQLVANGKLINLPTTRSLIKDQKTTGGQAYLSDWGGSLFAQARVKNLFFIPQNPVPAADFKAKFMDYCAHEGLDYCYIVKGGPFGSSIWIYKMNAKTGAETPQYGAELKDIAALRTLRDIMFASDDMAVYNNIQPGISAIAPSIILKEAEIKPTQKIPVRAPLVPRP